jgi:DNA-binding LacI/PurR family transcriptional regulator
LQVAHHFRELIRTGDLEPMERLPAEADLAANLRISRGTLRQAIELLEAEELIVRSKGKGTFVAGRGSRSKTRRIGFCIPYLRDSLSSEILMGVESALRDNNYSLVLTHAQGNLQIEREALQRLLRDDVDGIILFPTSDTAEPRILEELIPPPFPLVLIDRLLPGVQADAVVVDNEGGARAAVQHLLDVGHSRIACVTSPGRPTTVIERIRGYESAMVEAGEFPLAAVSLAGAGAPSRMQGTVSVPSYTDAELEPVMRLMKSNDRPTAVFCINDFVAMALLRALQQAGITVPDEVAIVGFDDIAAAAMPGVSLTTVAQPKYEIGRAAAGLLLEQIHKHKRSSSVNVLPTELMIRATSCRTCDELAR